MKNLWLEIVSCCGLLISGCGQGTISINRTANFTNVFSGQSCSLKEHSYVERPKECTDAERNASGLPGDNMDDEASCHIDCVGDGNSGQGDDKRHPCTPDSFPQPGCDEDGCCEDEAIPPPPIPEPTAARAFKTLKP